jgi:Trypsin-like peptidase domain
VKRLPVRLVALLGLIIHGGFSPSEALANLPKEVGQRDMPAVVFLLAGDLKSGKLVPVSSGSGTILTADGAILTNHHVIYDKAQKRLHDFVAVGLLKSYDQPPELTCMAVPAHGLIDVDLDLAVLKCEQDLSGKPYRAHGWPTIPVGASKDLIPGVSEVYVIGYPGIGGPTINVTRGTVSGFLGREGGAGRFWIKTDAAIAHGNSGGTAIDEEGKLVGIPTVFVVGQEDLGERAGRMRPVELAEPLIARAKAGWDPGQAADATPTPMPSGPAIGPPAGPSAGTLACATEKGVTVSGHVYANDNSAPIEGAYIIIFRPGIRRKEVKSDYSNVDALYLTYTISDQDGSFNMPCPIPRNQSFTVVVLAKGFVELSGDDVLNTAKAPERFEPWGGKVYLQRLE